MARDFDAGEHDRDQAEARDAAADDKALLSDREARSGDAGAGARSDAPEAPKKRGRGKLIPLVIALGLVGAGAYEGYGYWTDGRFMVSTDDAYVAVDFAQLAPKVSGYIARVDAVTNAHVAKGAPLVTLDDGDSRVALRVAEADIASQRAALIRLERQKEAAAAAVTQARARVAAAQASLAQAQADFARYNRLAANDVASGQKLDAARAAQATAEANLQEAQAGVVSASAQISVYDAQKGEVDAALARAEAARDQAARNLADTVIRAPYDGVVGNLSIAVGDYVTPGKRLLAVVPLGSVHVDANFKETELADMVPGTPVTLAVDAYPDRTVT
ncbi:MAG: HlyD family secretion protein, partial [Pseudomonadota bacterium]|nr:HlyD family secretion protein [Pseudomonadota bacterium]